MIWGMLSMTRHVCRQGEKRLLGRAAQAAVNLLRRAAVNLVVANIFMCGIVRTNDALYGMRHDPLPMHVQESLIAHASVTGVLPLMLGVTRC